MNNNKTILHIIQNFGRGGAETAVVGALKNLTEYRTIAVAMDSFNEFGDELKCDKYYCLNLKSYYHFPLAIKKLRKIIIDEKVDLVHSTLYWAIVLSRFACPKNIPLVSSIQASLSNSFEYKKKWIGWLDRFSYNRRESTILGVSKDTLDDYFNFLKLQRHRNYVLYNFVDTKAYPSMVLPKQQNGEHFKLVSVGSFKLQKNQLYLLEALKRLKGEEISLDIYGEGALRPVIEKFIKDNELPVRLMGQVKNLDQVMSGYDLFVMPSLYEGFSLAVLEGMLMEIPMLLSDIATFREQCAATAVYFPLNDVNELAEKIRSLKNNTAQLEIMGRNGRIRVLQHFTLDHHMAALRKIYQVVLNQ